MSAAGLCVLLVCLRGATLAWRDPATQASHRCAAPLAADNTSYRRRTTFYRPSPPLTAPPRPAPHRHHSLNMVSMALHQIIRALTPGFTVAICMVVQGKTYSREVRRRGLVEADVAETLRPMARTGTARARPVHSHPPPVAVHHHVVVHHGRHGHFPGRLPLCSEGYVRGAALRAPTSLAPFFSHAQVLSALGEVSYSMLGIIVTLAGAFLASLKVRRWACAAAPFAFACEFHPPPTSTVSPCASSTTHRASSPTCSWSAT